MEGGPAHDSFILTLHLILSRNGAHVVFVCSEGDVVIEHVIVRGHPRYVIVVISAIFNRPGVTLAVGLHFLLHYLRRGTVKLLSFTGGCQKPLLDI